jgi:serine/threonine-protein phosphatase 2A regulatory subunit B'
MVYNALKMFMEINPDIFDDTMQQYKHSRIQYVVFCVVFLRSL